VYGSSLNLGFTAVAASSRELVVEAKDSSGVVGSLRPRRFTCFVAESNCTALLSLGGVFNCSTGAMLAGRPPPVGSGDGGSAVVALTTGEAAAGVSRVSIHM